MILDKWKVYIASTEKQKENILYNSLQTFFDLLSFQLTEDFSFEEMSQDYHLVIVPNYAKEFCSSFLESLLCKGYGEISQDTGFGRFRYLFLSDVLSTRFETYQVKIVGKILQDLKIAETANTSRLFPAIQKLFCKNALGKDRKISTRRLQQSIEKYLPSGAEELQELIFRDSNKTHQIFKKQEVGDGGRKIEIPPAVRLLLGAYNAGDIGCHLFCLALNSVECQQEQIQDQSALTLLCKETETRKESFRLDEEHCASLADYLRYRKILFIEDQLKEEFWDHVIPALMGISGQLYEKEEKTDDPAHIFHVNSVQEALKNTKMIS